MKRRDFIKSVAAGITSPFFTNLFGFKTKEYIIPYVEQPENIIPGIAEWYSSVCKQCPAGCGIQVKIREGRAKKIEGNPNFPVNKGKLCARGQAGLQVLYNPDRIEQPLFKKDKGEKFTAVSWDESLAILTNQLKKVLKRGKNDRVVFLSEPLRGSLGTLITSFMSKCNSNHVLSYEFLNDNALQKANKLCFGSQDIPHYDIENSKYILSFGAGFLESWISPVKYSVGYGKMREMDHGGKRGRLVHFEPRLSLTGANADEWFPVNPETEGLLALSIAHVIVKNRLNNPLINDELPHWEIALRNYDPESVAKKTNVPSEEIIKVSKEFASNQPGIALCGGSATTQENGTFNAVAANILNYLVGNIGKKGGIMFNTTPLPPFSEGIEKSLSFAELIDLGKKMNSGMVDVLFVNNTNPIYNTPKSTNFAKSLANVPFIVSFSSFLDETSMTADLIIPTSTYLESWGDYIPITDNGQRTVGLLQSTISSTFNSRSVGDVLLSLAKNLGGDIATAFPWDSFYEYLRNSWKGLYNFGKKHKTIDESTFEKFWENSVKKGGYWEEKEGFTYLSKTPTPDILSKISYKQPSIDEKTPYHLNLYSSVKLFDGRGANQPWLQQLPEPLVTSAWGSWVEINPDTADKMGIKEGSVLEIESEVGSLKLPAYIYPAIHPDTIAIPIGQGHIESFGRYAQNIGENPLQILLPKRDITSGALAWNSTKVAISKTEEHLEIIKTEPDVIQPGLEDGLNEMERHIVQWVDPEELEKLTEEELEPIKALPTRDLQKPPHFLSSLGLSRYRTSKFHKYEYRWGMVIDLDKCTGCSACMVACYAENNLPLVSPKEMSRRRHKNWIRVDRYWVGKYPNIKAKQIPVNCYQCGNAPCEPVCPVYAAFHTEDGLNGQVYQRCIGTRYCNANCPYRARLFNWFSPEWPKPLDEQLSSELSVRTSGITDKCSFCVQRIRQAKDTAKDEERHVKDGEVQPACAQTCPSSAITFGNLIDEKSKVSKLTRNPRRYRVLEELNTEPAVTYLKAVRKSVESKHE